MDIYLVFGFISEDGSDEGHTYIYGVSIIELSPKKRRTNLKRHLSETVPMNVFISST